MSPRRGRIGRERPAVPGLSLQHARRPAFHWLSCKEPAASTTRPIASGTARDSAGSCISIAASATPDANTARPTTVQTKNTHAHERGQPADLRLGADADGPAVAPEHGDERRPHHRHHHHDPHAKERRRGAQPGLSGHPHPRHGHRPPTGHRHAAHRRHRRGPDDRDRGAGREEQRRGAHPCRHATIIATALNLCRIRHGGATRCPSRCVPGERGRATGTCPRGRPVRASRWNRCDTRCRPRA